MDENSSLAWSREKQLALQGHLLVNADFARGDGAVVEPEWFGAETGLVKTRMLQRRFMERFNRMPSLQEVVDGPDMTSESEDVRDLVSRAVTMAVAASLKYGLDVLVGEVRYWNKDLLYRSYVKRGWGMYSQGRPSDAFLLMEEMIGKLRDVDRGQDRRVDWTAFAEHLATRETEYADALTWGHPLFDARLMPESDSGSLVRGQNTVLLSGTNRGKSRCMTSVVVHNFLRGKAVLWMVHEDPEIDVVMNFWCCLLQMNRGQLLKFYRTPEGQQTMAHLAPLVNAHVEFAFMPPTGLCVEDVIASVRRRQTQRVAKHGRGFDLLVDDYPKKLTARKVTGDTRHVITYVYDQFMGIALEFNLHSVLAFQANRGGHGAALAGGKRLCERCRRTQVSERWINETDAGEAWAPMENASNVISLNRDRDMEQAGITVFSFCKTKASQGKGWAVAVRGRYDWARTHSPDWEATSFYADHATSAQVGTWLVKYNGSTVPENELTEVGP